MTDWLDTYETLVLDATYQPMYRTPWWDAVNLVVKGLVYVIEEHERVIRSPSMEMHIPSVVVFTKPKSTEQRSVKFSREGIYLRDNGTCQYCGAHVARDEMTYEHVIPRSRGGKTNWENIVVACVDCNQRKGDHTPIEAHMRLRRPPFKPEKVVGAVRWGLKYHDNMPETWKSYLYFDQETASEAYWNAELEEDD